MAKVIKKKKLKILPFIIFVIVIALMVFFVDIILDTRIKNIIIKGNSILSDQEIIDMAGLKHYPSFYKTTSSKMSNNIKTSPFIKKVKIKRKFYHVIEIEVEEYKVLLKREDNGKLVLENKKELALDQEIPYYIPKLINYVPNTKMSDLIDGMLKVNEEVKNNISEILYDPNEFDKDRFLLYMDDGNSVYLTLTKFKMINYYNEVLPQLEGRKGYLYLDSGNHFQIMQ